MSTIKRFFQPVLGNKIELLKYIFWWTINSIYGIGSLFFIQAFISLVESNSFESINILLLSFLAFNIICIFILIKFTDWTWSNIFLSELDWIADNYIKKFINLSNTSIETLGTGKTISIISTGFSTWRKGLLDIIINLINLFITIVTTIYIISSFGFIYIFIFVILIVVFYIISYFLNNIALEYRRKRKEYEIEYDRHIVKIIMSKFDILQNNKINSEINELKKINYNLYKANIPVELYINLTALLPYIILFICYTIFMIVITATNNISYATITIIFLILSYLFNILMNSVWFFKNFTKEFVSVRKLWDLFDNTPEIEGIKNGKKFKYKEGEFEIRNLSFYYGDTEVFNDFSIKIHGGKVTAFVGESGGGKTTLMKLLAGYIVPNKGNIFVDGQPFNTLDLISYYKNIGYLTQDPSVFDGTILDNLTYGAKEEISEKRLEEVIKLSRCEFIYDFKKGLKTQIGERGVRLSGGQKQRLAIAKIFIKDPDIIFLDEPTSALDSMSEKLIQESFNNLFKGRTVIIIAHRLQTVKNADEIFVIEKGGVIEKGNHESLVQKGGYYKEMLDLQSGF